MVVFRMMNRILVLLLMLPFSVWAGTEPADTIEQLVARFDDSFCRQCHAEIYRKWEKSWHSRPLPPLSREVEQFVMHFPGKNGEVRVEVSLRYHLGVGPGKTVRTLTRSFNFDRL